MRTETRRERLERFFRPEELLRPGHDQQLSLGAAILVIGGLSLVLWSAIIGIVVRVC